MAWIVWTTGLVNRTEVIGIASRLRVSRREAAAMCMQAWEWADQETSNGHAPNVLPEQLDETIGVVGLAAAMMAVRWLESDGNGGMVFPIFDRWNTESTKARLSNAERQKKWRDAHKNDPKP